MRMRTVQIRPCAAAAMPACGSCSEVSAMQQPAPVQLVAACPGAATRQSVQLNGAYPPQRLVVGKPEARTVGVLPRQVARQRIELGLGSGMACAAHGVSEARMQAALPVIGACARTQAVASAQLSARSARLRISSSKQATSLQNHTCTLGSGADPSSTNWPPHSHHHITHTLNL